MELRGIQDAARAYYSANERRLEQLEGSLAYILVDIADRAGVKVHHVSARRKRLDTFLDKFERKPHLKVPTDVQDLVGGRIVTLFRSDLTRLEEKLNDVFDVVGTENKIEDADDESFGYMSVHYICRLKGILRGPHYDGLHDLEFEIQLRTILMDAWANVSHHIDYKGESSIPRGLRRDFNALSALFYVADSSFQQFYEGSQASKALAISELSKPSSSDVLLNADTLSAALHKWFPDRKVSPADSVSELMEEISNHTEHKTLDDLLQVVERRRLSAERYEEEFPARERAGGKKIPYATVGILRVILSIEDEDFAEIRDPYSVEDYARYRS